MVTRHDERGGAPAQRSRPVAVQTQLAAARELFRAYHQGHLEHPAQLEHLEQQGHPGHPAEEQQGVSEAHLDAALGLDERAVVLSSYEPALEARHPAESVVYLPTPYPVCRTFFHAVPLTARDLVVDMGCGSGRFLLYGALTTPARFLGVELVERRYAAAVQAIEGLGLASRVELVHGNVLEQDLAAGTVFYAFRPFSAETEAEVVSRIEALARARAVTVGACRLLPSLFDPLVFERTFLGDLQIYRSQAR